MSVSRFSDSPPTLGMLLAESRVLCAVAGDTVLHGSADHLMRHLGVDPGVFRAAVHDLVAGGWIFATTSPEGDLTIGRERRRRDAGLPAFPERRRPASLWEGPDADLRA